jgi:hypothetical protein
MEILSWKKHILKRSKRLDSISKSYQEKIDFVFKVCEKECNTKIRIEEEHNEMLKAYREAQELNYLYQRIIYNTE